MIWLKRLVIASPFAFAASLNLLSMIADRLQVSRHHIERYVFLFFAPWAWLLDRGWSPMTHRPWLELLIGYTTLLWIPAALYSACLWLLFKGFHNLTVRHRSH